MPNHLTLHEMAVAIREKELSPVELVEAHLSQIERHNPKLNVFVVLLAGEAREASEGELREREGRTIKTYRQMLLLWP